MNYGFNRAAAKHQVVEAESCLLEWIMILAVADAPNLSDYN